MGGEKERGGKHTEKTGSLGLVVLADAAEGRDAELDALQLADAELAIVVVVVVAAAGCCGECAGVTGEEASASRPEDGAGD
jgi:hypothetical protein